MHQAVPSPLFAVRLFHSLYTLFALEEISPVLATLMKTGVGYTPPVFSHGRGLYLEPAYENDHAKRTGHWPTFFPFASPRNSLAFDRMRWYVVFAFVALVSPLL